MTEEIAHKVIGEKAELDLVEEAHNDSSGLSWLWAFLFGPIYYWVHGFVGIGFGLIGIAIFLALLHPAISFLTPFVSAFMAYPAWRKRARKKAEKLVAVSKMARS